MMSRYKEARIAGVMALLVALSSAGVEAKEETKPQSPLMVFDIVRATRYHKSDANCDSWTASGQTSEKIRLPDDKLLDNPNIIGNVAVDDSLIPDGSLVYDTTQGRLYCATTGGEAVIDRTAAKKTADRLGLPDEFRDAPVFDFYSKHEIVGNYYSSFWVIPHSGEKDFTDLHEEYQQRRLYASYWLPKLSAILESTADESIKTKIRIVMGKLKDNDMALAKR